MRIERVDMIHMRMNLVSPFETSYGQDYEMDKIILKVYANDFIAFSECVAEGYPYYAYETVGTAKEILKKFLRRKRHSGTQKNYSKRADFRLFPVL